MTEYIKKVSLPVDESGFLRRECPYCRRQFKVHMDEIESLEDQEDHYCPYCGQIADGSEWWTQEQEDYFRKVQENIAADLLNEHLIRPLKRSLSRSSCMRFEGKEVEKRNELIQPELDDMKLFALPCCQKKLKIVDEWEEVVHCYYCGFQH